MGSWYTVILLFISNDRYPNCTKEASYSPMNFLKRRVRTTTVRYRYCKIEANRAIESNSLYSSDE